jgi:hypothetical protein
VVVGAERATGQAKNVAQRQIAQKSANRDAGCGAAAASFLAPCGSRKSFPTHERPRCVPSFDNDAKSAATAVVVKYIERASVAVPFIIAGGFAIAAICAMLIERFGAVIAYWIMAAALAALGLVTAAVVTVKEYEEEVADKEAEEADTAAVASEATAQAIGQILIELLNTLATMPGGLKGALSVGRMLGRNLPLVLFVVLFGGLLWPEEPNSAAHQAGTADENSGDGLR